MNTICPRCGKDNTTPFFDQKLKTHGFECENCKKDFGVDDGKILKDYEDDLIEFDYERKDKDGETKKVSLIKQGKNKAVLKLSILHKNKMLEPFEDIDFSIYYFQVTALLFEKLYILDWNKNSTSLLLKGDEEEYKIVLKFAHKDELSFTGIKNLPVYLKVIDELFKAFFQGDNK